jgi:transposase
MEKFITSEIGNVGVTHRSSEYDMYVGLDVHKASIAVATASPGRESAEYRSQISNTLKSVEKLVSKIRDEISSRRILFCYEAGPCGYVLYHQLHGLGYDCIVVAPSLIPRKPGERIKTDRRDAIKLAASLRSGDLTAIWIPDEDQESMRDLTRARDDMKCQERKARQQLNAFVLRHGYAWPGNKTRWTKTHFNWLEEIEFKHPWQQIVLQEYIDAVKAATRRVEDITDQMMKALSEWSLAPVVDSLIALRGIDKISAMVLLAELGDLRRFDTPKQLMAYLGLVPGEHSSGSSRRQKGITRAGNTHARRIVVESAWCYRFPPRQTMYMKRKAVNASDKARQIAWRAQKRLCGRYRDLSHSGKDMRVVCVAVARELLGFIWDIVRLEMPKVAV